MAAEICWGHPSGYHSAWPAEVVRSLIPSIYIWAVFMFNLYFSQSIFSIYIWCLQLDSSIYIWCFVRSLVCLHQSIFAGPWLDLLSSIHFLRFINLYLRGSGFNLYLASPSMYVWCLQCFINLYLRGSGFNLYLASPSIYIWCFAAWCVFISCRSVLLSQAGGAADCTHWQRTII